MRSREMGGSWDRLFLAAGASWQLPRAFSVPRSAGPAGPVSGRRGCSSAQEKVGGHLVRRKATAASAGGRRGGGREGSSPGLVSYPGGGSIPPQRRVGWVTWGSWGCGSGWKKLRGWGCCDACRAPGMGPRLRRALHGGEGAAEPPAGRPRTASSSSRMLGGADCGTEARQEGGKREEKENYQS